MSGIYYSDLVEVLESVFVPVYVDNVNAGWETRARSSGGFPSAPLAVFWHHTASDTSPQNDLSYMIDGSPDAPVGNMLLDRDGKVWPVAAGASNCAGKGGPYTFSRGTIPLDSGNTRGWQIEVANNGVGEPYPQAQIDALFAATNALNYHFGNSVDDVVTHNEWCEPSCPGRKIDPATAAAVQGPWRPSYINSSGTWNCDDIRAELRRRYNLPEPTPPTPPPLGDDVQNYYIVTGANARFIGTPAQVFWTGPGTDKALMAIDTQLTAGNLQIVDLTGGPNAFSATFLAGPIPEGDTLYNWSGDEFAGHLGY